MTSSIPVTLTETNSAILGSDKDASYYVRELILQASRKQSNILSFYKGLRRNLLNLFSQFAIIDDDDKLRTIKCIPGSPERAIAKRLKDNNLILPILSLEQKSTDNEPEHRRYTPLISTKSIWDDKKQRAFRVVSLAPKAVSIEYEVSIWSSYKEDLDQLTEQIQRYFNPSIDTNTEFTKYGKIFLVQEFDESELDVPDSQDRVLIRTFKINIETHIPSPEFLLTATGKIEQVILDVPVGYDELEQLATLTTDSANVIAEVVNAPLVTGESDFDRQNQNLISPLLVSQMNWAPNNEFEIPLLVSTTGKSWTRVTTTSYQASTGWAFCYKFSNRIKLRLYDNNLIGTVPNQAPSGYTSDISVDTSLFQVTSLNSNGTSSVQQITHDEPDLVFHPDASSICLGWNVRLGTSTVNPTGLQGHIMDQKFIIYDLNGNALSSSDSFATNKTLESQWRPIIEPLRVGRNASSYLYTFTGNHKDTAFFNIISAVTPFSFGLSADVNMAPSIGTNRNVDQHACELPNGNIFCTWCEVIGKGKIRWRIFDASGNPTTSSYNELSAVLQYGKDEPRVKYLNNKIWLTYHHIANPLPGGGEYEGIDIYACIFDYDPNTGAVTLAVPEFPVHTLSLPGLQRRPELALYRDRGIFVFEHYPSGTVMANGVPAYNGPSHIVGKVFRNSGRALTKVFTIDTSASNNNGALPYMLRPDVAVSNDNNTAMVCWTAAATTNIYSMGNTGKLWARILDLTQLG